MQVQRLKRAVKKNSHKRQKSSLDKKWNISGFKRRSSAELIVCGESELEALNLWKQRSHDVCGVWEKYVDLVNYIFI